MSSNCLNISIAVEHVVKSVLVFPVCIMELSKVLFMKDSSEPIFSSIRFFYHF